MEQLAIWFEAESAMKREKERERQLNEIYCQIIGGTKKRDIQPIFRRWKPLPWTSPAHQTNGNL